jgi:hypothetical protein
MSEKGIPMVTTAHLLRKQTNKQASKQGKFYSYFSEF